MVRWDSYEVWIEQEPLQASGLKYVHCECKKRSEMPSQSIMGLRMTNDVDLSAFPHRTEDAYSWQFDEDVISTYQQSIYEISSDDEASKRTKWIQYCSSCSSVCFAQDVWWVGSGLSLGEIRMACGARSETKVVDAAAHL